MEVRLDSPDDIQAILWDFARHRILTVAARTGILSYLSSNRSTTERAAEELGLDGAAAGKIIRALSSFGILGYENNEYFVHEKLAAYFQGDDEDITAMIHHSHHLYNMWGESIEKWLRGETVQRRERSSEEIKDFGDAMKAMGTHVSRQVAASIDLRNVKTMLDVGGGFGHYTRSFIKKNPDIEGTVIDTPDTIAHARRLAENDPHSQKIRWLEGDYHDIDWGKDYDLVLFANVLHQEREDTARLMIEKGTSSLKHGGRLAVVDFSIDENKNNMPVGALFAVNMRSFGDTYSEPELRNWMEKAGLINIQRTDLCDFRWLITGFRIW